MSADLKALRNSALLNGFKCMISVEHKLAQRNKNPGNPQSDVFMRAANPEHQLRGEGTIAFSHRAINHLHKFRGEREALDKLPHIDSPILAVLPVYTKTSSKP